MVAVYQSQAKNKFQQNNAPKCFTLVSQLSRSTTLKCFYSGYPGGNYIFAYDWKHFVLILFTRFCDVMCM